MKRFWSTPEYRRQQEVRRRQANRRALRGRVTRRSHYGKTTLLVAPQVLSVFDQPSETLRFLNDLRSALHQLRIIVSVDLEAVERVSSDALLLMRSVIDDAKGVYRRVGGNLPKDPKISAKFKQSGFFTGFSKPPGKLPSPQGLIRRHTATRVRSEVAGELVSFAQLHADVADSVAAASYKALVELMSNTNNHAGRSRGRKRALERWRASVYCENQTAYFTFVDLGVGLLRSTAPRNFLRELGVTVLGYGEARLLANVFDGVVGASTSIPGRGFGLPTLRTMAKDGSVPSLQVLTSSLVAEVATMDTRVIDANFRGTIYRWTSNRTEQQS